MIHPDTELRFVNNEIGYGVFATQFIPKGTIVFVKDELDIEITKTKFKKMSALYQEYVEKYSYIDERGVRILSWDHAKYVNHKCDCNSMSTGYGFEIAIKDIEKDEEITDEYGMFNLPTPIEINCQCTNCRKTLLPNDIDNHHNAWDSKVMDAIQQINQVKQPLWDLLDSATSADVMAYLEGQREYRSVRLLKYLKLATNNALIREKTGT